MIRNSLVLLGLLVMIVSSCGDDAAPSDVSVIPSNLEVSITNANTGNGTISVVATADNAFHYDFYFGEGDNERVRESSGIATHTYAETGTYTVEVRALGNGVEYVDYSEVISVDVEEVEPPQWIPATGYSTPESYSGYTLLWQDEFDGTELNSAKWQHEIGGGGADGFGNFEAQYYREENTSVEDGLLFIQVNKETFGGKSYTSSRINTRDKFDFKFGRVDIRAAVPIGQGMWPALWMLGSNYPSVGWPRCGEIDIMEIIGTEHTVLGTAHWDNAGQFASHGGSRTLTSADFYGEFHVYSITWDSNTIRWFLNDVQYHALTITDSGLSEFQEKFYFIFNVAVGGNKGAGNPTIETPFPQRMVIDYVRVFQLN